MKTTHFTEVTPLDIGLLEDAQNGLLDAKNMITATAQRVWHLQLEGWLIGLKLTRKGAEILESLDTFKKSLK